MAIRLVVIDMDGTLLDDALMLSQKNEEKIHDLIDKGIDVVFATGRTFKATQHYAEIFIRDIPLITYNGALIKTSLSEEIIASKTMLLEDAYKILAFGEKENTYTKVYINDVLYVDKETPEAIAFSRNHGIKYQAVGRLKDNIKKPPYLIVFKDSIGKITEMRKKLSIFNNLSYTLSTPGSLEFMPKNTSKALSIAKLAKKIGIKREETLAIGNSLNDYDMLKWAGIGVAMKNSDVELKKYWNNISQYDNNEDGVSKIIDKYITYQ
ncbi:MAG: Cof-type HAD-IIB family hydrolase [Eubacteriales bacterium]